MGEERRPLFCDTELAARIDGAEALLMAEAAEAARRRVGSEGDKVLVMPIAGGIATWSGEDSPLNKVAGLGFAGAPSAEELASVERALAQRGAPVRIELASLAQAGVSAFLSDRGYRLVGFESVLGRRLPIDPAELAIAPGVSLAESGPEELGTWLDAMIAGVAQPDTQGVSSGESFPSERLRQVLADLVSTSGLVRFAARRAGEIAGGASLRIGGAIAQLIGAATLPRHRRRGVQTSLLAARLARASQAGCEVAVVTTEPGSKSQENVQRQGFHLLYTRAILVREPAHAADVQVRPHAPDSSRSPR